MNGIGYGITPFMGASGILARSSGGGGVPFVNEYSMSFDGIDERFNGASTFSDLDGQNKATFSLWVKPQLNQYGILFHIPINTTIAQGQVLCFLDNSYRVRWSMDTTSYYSNSLTNVITLNAWNHILICIDLTQGANQDRSRVFINGVNQTAVSNLGTRTQFSTSTGSLLIGEETLGYLTPFLGNMDEFAMWVGTDQRANVSDIYNGGVPFDLSTLATAPDHWWRMGDNDTWSGSQWTLSDNIGSYDLNSINMEEADRVPISPNSYTQNSFSFDGVDECFNIADPTSFTDTGDFSISAWVKYTTTGALHIFNIRDNRILYVSSGRIVGAFRNSGGGFVSITSPSLYNDNNWHHVLFVKNSTNLILYVDGAQVISNSNGGATQSGGTSFARISARASGSTPTNYYNGLVDEIAFFESDQSSNVSTIFNNGIPTDISSLNPLGHWRMGENATWNGSTWTLTDQGSGGNNATSVNMEEADKTGDQAYVL